MASEKLEGALEIFALQDRLAHAVTSRLRVGGAASARPKEAPEVRAYELVTRATALVTRFRRETLEQAIDLLEDSLWVDAEYAPAHAELARTYDLHAITTTNAAESTNRSNMRTAPFALDPNSAEGHLWKGYALWRQERSGQAQPVLRRAVELAPNDALPSLYWSTDVLDIT